MSEVQYRSLEVRPAVCNPRATGSRNNTGVGGSSERRLCLQKFARLAVHSALGIALDDRRES